MKVTKYPLRLQASSKAVITHFLFLPGNNRVKNIVKRVKSLSEEEVKSSVQKLMKDFATRHRNIEKVFLYHFRRVQDQYGKSLENFSANKKLLLGSFFTKEYSIQAAALFNPSIVSHPDQTNLKTGEQRFIISLRATGEGHISSIVFQTGIVDKTKIRLDKSSGLFSTLVKRIDTNYTKDFISRRASKFTSFNPAVLDPLPQTFTYAEAHLIFKSTAPHQRSHKHSIEIIENILDSNYDLENSEQMPINEKVIFPNARSESMGIEDARFVLFNDGDNTLYYATYTAYDGRHINTQLIETKDFTHFKIRTLYGTAISNKGMALFPEKVNGKYVMLSRQGGEKIYIMFSDDLYYWQEMHVLMEPKYIWEIVQLGNCGSPIKTSKGWLVLTHGVGVMRTYVISAILLDLNDPSKIIGRLSKPLIEADEKDREGYVPNVVYTCGVMCNGDILVIPYAVSDSATAFATVKLDELLNEMEA
jgi:predicted GH43/DUF377 family glycosyl hydrolase